MANLPADNRQGSSLPCSQVSPAGMAKAMTAFQNLRDLTPHDRLIAGDDARRLIATVDAQLLPCSRNEATSLVAELLLAYPSARPSPNDREAQRDFEGYSLKLFEAFRAFSFVIGKAAVSGATGIPAKQRFKPQPSDIVEFCTAERDRRLTVKTMAQRHLAEAARRERQREEEARFATTPEQRKRVADLVAGFKAQAIPDAPR